MDECPLWKRGKTLLAINTHGLTCNQLGWFNWHIFIVLSSFGMVVWLWLCLLKYCIRVVFFHIIDKMGHHSSSEWYLLTSKNKLQYQYSVYIIVAVLIGWFSWKLPAISRILFADLWQYMNFNYVQLFVQNPTVTGSQSNFLKKFILQKLGNFH